MDDRSKQTTLQEEIVAALKQRHGKWLLAREPLDDEDPSDVNMAVGEDVLYVEEASRVQLDAIASIVIDALASMGPINVG